MLTDVADHVDVGIRALQKGVDGNAMIGQLQAGGLRKFYVRLDADTTTTVSAGSDEPSVKLYRLDAAAAAYDAGDAYAQPEIDPMLAMQIGESGAIPLLPDHPDERLGWRLDDGHRGA